LEWREGAAELVSQRAESMEKKGLTGGQKAGLRACPGRRALDGLVSKPGR